MQGATIQSVSFPVKVRDSLFSRWIYAKERDGARRLSGRNGGNFAWGEEWLRRDTTSVEKLKALNGEILEHGDSFFVRPPAPDFSLIGSELRFASFIQTPEAANNTVSAEWFPSSRAAGRAVVVLPHWHAKPTSYRPLCRLLNLRGLSALLLTLPYHGTRKPRECGGAEYAVSANLGRTIVTARQAVADIRSALNWLESQGYRRLGMAGVSLGSWYGFLASAYDSRISASVFTHCCSTVSDVVWEGIPEIGARIAAVLSREELRACWSAINPIACFDRFARHTRKSLVIHGRYDHVFPRLYTREIVAAFRQWKLDHRLLELPCGHYTLSWPPYLIAACHAMAAFLTESL